jgi:hypothetical protein
MIYEANTGTKMGVREKSKKVSFINATRFFILVLAFVD